MDGSTGYAPCDDPDYVITVFMGGDSSGASDAGPVYKGPSSII